MRLLKYLRFALIGWLAGLLCTLLIGLIWPSIFPGVVHPEHYFAGEGLSLSNTVVLSLMIATLPALVGGMIGGVLPREGGRREQQTAAALGGIFLSTPFACFNYWLLSGA